MDDIEDFKRNFTKAQIGLIEEGLRIWFKQNKKYKMELNTKEITLISSLLAIHQNHLELNLANSGKIVDKTKNAVQFGLREDLKMIDGLFAKFNAEMNESEPNKYKDENSI